MRNNNCCGGLPLLANAHAYTLEEYSFISSILGLRLVPLKPEAVLGLFQLD